MAEQQPGSVVKKKSKGKPVSSGQKIMIVRLDFCPRALSLNI
jgi:hypothetical protein